MISYSSLVSEDIARAELYLKEASEVSFSLLPFVRVQPTFAVFLFVFSFLGGEKDNFAILLVKAAVHYNKADYPEALRLYARALRTNPKCSAYVSLCC